MKRAALLSAAALAAACGFWAPALTRWERTGYGDWQQFLHQWEAVRTGMLRYGELALWNPWHCGGTLLFEDPQAQGYSPLFWLLALPLGSNGGTKVFLVLHCAFGFAGMFLACRRLLGSSVTAACTGALVFGASGFFAWHGSGGHSAFLPFYFTPWLLLAWRQASRSLNAALAVAVLMAWTLWEGGVYPFPFFCLLLAFDGLAQLLAPDATTSRTGLVRAGALVIALMTLLGAWRLLPIVGTMTRYPRPTAGDDALTLSELADMLLAREHDYRFGHEYVWAEYGAFIGVLALSLAALGLAVAWRKRSWVLAGAVFFGAMTLGNVSPLHPWALLHHLPFFDSLRVPSRFAVLLTFYLAFAAALGSDRILTLLRPRAGWATRVLAWLVPLALTAEMLTAHAPTLDRWTNPPLEDLPDTGGYRVTSMVEYHGFASFPARGVSTRGCYTGMSYAAAPGLRVGRVAQASAAPGSARVVGRTANHIALAVDDAGSDGALLLNQTWARGWVSSAGQVRAGRDGRIRVEGLPEGAHDVVLRYVPESLAPAAATSLFGLVVLFCLLVPGPLRRGARRLVEGRRRFSAKERPAPAPGASS